MALVRSVIVSSILAVVTAPAANAQPFIFYRGILNSASFAPQGLPNGSIARGSIFSVFGRGLAPAEGVSISDFPLQNNLAGVSIEVCQGGDCVAAIPLFVRADQINAIMPSNAPLGPVSLRVTFGGAAGNFSPAEVIASSFGVFSLNSGGIGPGVVQNFTPEALPINSAVATANPGQTVILYGTGLGAGLNADNVAPQAGDLPAPVEIWVGGKPVTVKRYSGRSPCCAGLDQIVFDLPVDAPAGCYVPVTLRAGGVISNSITIAITNEGSGTCSDPMSPLDSAKSGGKTGVLLTSRLHLTSAAPAGPDFTSDLIAGIFQGEPTGPWHFNRLYSFPPAGSCTTYSHDGGALTNALMARLATNGGALDVGSELSIEGPADAATAAPDPAAGSIYAASVGSDFGGPPLTSLLFDDAAASRISSSGGADAGAFQVDLTLARGFVWTNRDSLSKMRRNEPLELRWSGGEGERLVVIAGLSFSRSTLSSSSFLCTERASLGQFTVPAWIAGAQVPADDSGGPPNAVVIVSALPAAATPFSATGLDVGYGLAIPAEMRGIHVE